MATSTRRREAPSGVVPGVRESCRSQQRQTHMDIAVDGVTAFGLFLTPVFYVGLRKMADYIGRERSIEGGDAVPETSHA